MIDISNRTVKISCPECKRPINVSLKQIANQAFIKCTCGKNIQLQDKNKSLTDLKKIFKR